jgi:threonine/homoserine/homoserine lactone efflux protein
MNSGYVDLDVLPTYVVAVLLICIAPGTDMAFIIATAVSGGRRAAVTASAGVALGVAVYSLIVACGVGVVIGRTPTALIVLQLLAVGYLLWLAWQEWTSRDNGFATTDSGPSGFLRGLVVNLTNPKMMLFFLTFLPQFLGDTDHPVMQLAMLGIVYLVVGFVVDVSIGLSAGTVRDRILSSAKARRRLTVVAAAVYLVLAVAVVIELTRMTLNS